MELYPKMVVVVDPATVPAGFVAADITPNWATAQNEWRQALKNTGPPADRWGTWTFDGTKPTLRGPHDDARSLWSIKVHAWSSQEPAGADHDSVVADIDASGLIDELKTIMRTEFGAHGITIVSWDYVIKTRFENTGVNGRTHRVEPEV